MGVSERFSGAPTLDTKGETPFDAGVYMLMGINGIGKSTIVDAIANDSPEVTAVHASQELRALFNGVSREKLEKLNPEEKLARMVIHFTSIFDEVTSEGGVVMLDTHLLVPIRTPEGVTYENIWSDMYSPYVNATAMLTADAEDVRGWRMEDELVTGRKRNVSEDDIRADQAANVVAFEELKAAGRLPLRSRIITNIDDRIEKTRQDIEAVFRGTD